MTQSHSDLWAALKSAEHDYDAACLIEQRLEAQHGAGDQSPRLLTATAYADAIEARMSAIIRAICERPVSDLDGLRVLAQLSQRRTDDRRVSNALAAAVLAFPA